MGGYKYGNQVGGGGSGVDSVARGGVSDLTTQLEDIAINAKTKGIVLDDRTKDSQNTPILKDLFLNSTSPVYLPSGTIYYNDTLVMGKNVEVYGTPQTKLWCTNINKDCISINDKSVLKKLKIQVDNNYAKAVLLVDGVNQINSCTVEDIDVIAWDYTGAGILLTAKPSGSFITDCNFNRIQISRMRYGIQIEDDYRNLNGWANANKFKNMKIQAVYGAYLEDGLPTANEINMQFQTASQTIAGIQCSGEHNIFTGFVWDVANYLPDIKYIYNFTQNSKNNVIDIPFRDEFDKYRIDNGTDNVVLNQQKTNIQPISPFSNYRILPDGTGLNKKPIFRGNQDDCLSYLDKKGATVTLSGTKNWGFSASRFFLPYLTDVGAWFEDPAVTPVIIEANLNGSFIDNLYFIGMSFNSGNIPDSFTVDIVTTNGGSYTNLATVTGNRDSTVIIPLSNYGQDIYKFKITITKAVNSTTFNPNNRIILQRIFGANIGTYFGSTYLEKGGGTLYGNLNMGSNYLTVGNIAALPTASATYRGQIIQVLGNGTTTADTLYTCLMSATGTYSWKQITAG